MFYIQFLLFKRHDYLKDYLLKTNILILTQIFVRDCNKQKNKNKNQIKNHVKVFLIHKNQLFKSFFSNTLEKLIFYKIFCNEKTSFIFILFWIGALNNVRLIFPYSTHNTAFNLVTNKYCLPLFVLIKL